MNVRSVALLALSLAACSSSSSDDRVARHAAAKLALEPNVLRVSSETELTGMRHQFHLITRDGTPVLIVVVPRDGELFDSKTADAFSRVTRGENAVANLGQLGAERIALWFGALGGGACPMPASTDVHFAHVSEIPAGLRLTYPAGGDKSQGITRTCVVELAPDGGLIAGRVTEDHVPQAQMTRGWPERAN